MGGEIWHDLVTFAVNKDYWGIENLSFIPGTVGAAPIQNIGAYGAELKDILENVETYEIKTGQKKFLKTKNVNSVIGTVFLKTNLKANILLWLLF